MIIDKVGQGQKVWKTERSVRVAASIPLSLVEWWSNLHLTTLEGPFLHHNLHQHTQHSNISTNISPTTSYHYWWWVTR